MAYCQQAVLCCTKIYCLRKDIRNGLIDQELIRSHRLNHTGVLFVTDLVKAALENPTGRNGVLPGNLETAVVQQ